MNVLERQGCSLHFWLTGPEDRPVVVFTHGVMMGPPGTELPVRRHSTGGPQRPPGQPGIL